MKLNVLWVLGLLLGAAFVVAPVSSLKAEEVKKAEPKKEEVKEVKKEVKEVKEEKKEEKGDNNNKTKKPSLPKVDTIEKWIGEKLPEELKKHINDRREEIQADYVKSGGEMDAYGEYKKYLTSLLTPAQMELYNHKGGGKEEKKHEEKKNEEKEKKNEGKKEEVKKDAK